MTNPQLDAAMIRELERRRVVVVPIVVGSLDTSTLPEDLKGKHYLDFRSDESYEENIRRIVDLFQIEKRERQRVLQEFRAGATGHETPVEYLRHLATTGHDQSQQVAAIAGLEKHRSPASILAITQRLLDPWGIRTIDRAIKACRRLHDCGGLVVLCATLFSDARFIHDKMVAINAILECSGGETIPGTIGDVGELVMEPRRVNGWAAVLAGYANPDVCHGVAFGAQYEGIGGWQGYLLRPLPTDVSLAAIEYVESRVPGIYRLFNRTLASKPDAVTIRDHVIALDRQLTDRRFPIDDI